MKLFSALFALMLVMTVSARGSDSAPLAKQTAHDRALLQLHALKDAEVTARLARAERPAIRFDFLDSKAEDGCIDACVATCQGGTGSAACWQACHTSEGYSSATCAPRCGVSTPAGADACWQACSGEGYSTATCAPRCGVTTYTGSADCWQHCTAEGYSSATCAPRCGVTTPTGSQACWSQCTTEGYQSSVCLNRCGNG